MNDPTPDPLILSLTVQLTSNPELQITLAHRGGVYAAWLSQSGIKPHDCMLCQRRDPDGTLRFWVESRGHKKRRGWNDRRVNAEIARIPGELPLETRREHVMRIILRAMSSLDYDPNTLDHIRRSLDLIQIDGGDQQLM